MSKLVKILDRKPMEIYLGRKTRGPIIGVRLDESIIARLLRSVDAPRDIYAMGPANKTVKLTLENYMIPEEELFAEEKKETSSLADSIKNVLNKNTEETTTPVTEDKVEETQDAVEDSNKSESGESEDVTSDETSISEDTETEEKVSMNETSADVEEKDSNDTISMTSGFIHVESVDSETDKVDPKDFITTTALTIDNAKPSQNHNKNNNYKKNNYKK